jgi:hypothetical protein
MEKKGTLCDQHSLSANVCSEISLIYFPKHRSNSLKVRNICFLYPTLCILRIIFNNHGLGKPIVH